MNMVQMHICGIKPLKTLKAEIDGYELIFFGDEIGLKESSGKALHGVVYLMTKF